MLVVDVQPVGHGPVHHQVVVERNDCFESLQELIDIRQVGAYRTVLRVNVADGLDEAISETGISSMRSLIRYLQRPIDVRCLPDDPKNQLEIIGLEELEQALSVLWEQMLVGGMLEQ